MRGLVASDQRSSACLALDGDKAACDDSLILVDMTCLDRETSKHEPHCHHLRVRHFAKAQLEQEQRQSETFRYICCRYFVQPGVYNLNRFRLFVVGMQLGHHGMLDFHRTERL